MSPSCRCPVSNMRDSLRLGRASPALRRWGVLAAAVLLAVGIPLVSWAQEASPVIAVCDAPPLPPGTPTPPEAMASPAASEPVDATPMPADSIFPPGEPADDVTTARVTAAAENLASCLATGNALGFAALVTPNYLLEEFDTTNPYDLETELDGFPTFELLAAEDVLTHKDGRFSIALTTLLGGMQVDHFRAYFVDGENGYLLLDEEDPLPIEGAAVQVDVILRDHTFELSQTTIPAGELVSFTVRNEGAYLHEFVVLQLPEGATIDEALSDPALAEQVMFVGGVFVAPGAEADVGLTNLAPGTYTVACFLDEPGGVPHFAQGMVADLTVA